MRNLVVSILIPFILLFNCNSAVSFDFAPEIGDYAPNFQLEGFNKNIKTKKTWELSDFEGHWLVMYFYPKDFTAGCTLEAKGFSELKKDFSIYNAEIVGISADNQDILYGVVTLQGIFTFIGNSTLALASFTIFKKEETYE